MTHAKAQNTPPLRWGFSTGATMCAVAVTSWLTQKTPQSAHAHTSITSVPLEFLDRCTRYIPVLSEKVHDMLAVQKDGGDDPDCTHKAIFYGQIRKACLSEAQEKDYILHIGGGTLIVHALDGIGTCTRQGFDCEQGKWAITQGPRRMLQNNLRKHGMDSGIWLFSFGVLQGKTMAQKSLNTQLGIVGGISILGSTGLVRPFSHEAYKATIKLCVRAHKHEGGTSMVFCTGGRTQKGAQKYLPALPQTAFTCIADFIAASINSACAHGMQDITIACMPGKLCKYAAGYENTHAHKTTQDRELFYAVVQKHLPRAHELHKNLRQCVTIREALLCIPESARKATLHELAEQALEQLARFISIAAKLRLLLFDFNGDFLLEKSILVPASMAMSSHAYGEQNIDTTKPANTEQQNTLTKAPEDPYYFLQSEAT